MGGIAAVTGEGWKENLDKSKNLRGWVFVQRSAPRGRNQQQMSIHVYKKGTKTSKWL